MLRNKKRSILLRKRWLPVRLFIPPQAKKQNLQGYVLLSVLIDEQGEVKEAQVLESSPPGLFDASALEGIRRWRFNPARSQGKPVATWIQQKSSSSWDDLCARGFSTYCYGRF